MRVYGLIGYPLEYTLSPRIHGYVFSRLNIDAAYVPFRVSPKRLMHFIEFSRDSLDGFNVTTPHKVSVASLVDELSGESSLINSVNTVVNNSGRLIGYNTDYLAIKDALAERGVKEDEAIVVGAGGVARAVVLALVKLGFRKVAVLNRSVERARELCSISSRLGLECVAEGLTQISVKAPLLVNTTPMGVKEEFPIRLNELGVSIVLDLAYKPAGETDLIAKARAMGIEAIDGLEILVRQALEADKIWLGDLGGISYKDVLNHLRGG